MISLDPALLNADSDARRRHRALAERAGLLTILVRAKSGSRDVIRDGTLTLIPFIAPNPLWIVPRALAAARTVHQHVNESVDLLVTQDMFLSGMIGVLLRRWLNRPLLVQSHTTIFDNSAWVAESPVQRRLLQIVARGVLTRADTVRTVNQHEKDAIIKRGFPADRVEVLPLGTASRDFADVSPDQVNAARENVGVSTDEKIILWVGNPIGFKRLHVLFKVLHRVLERVPNTRLLLIGANYPEYTLSLQLEMEQEGVQDRVILHPPIAHVLLPAYYALAHVYALTSSYEGLPRVLFEAGAAGLPAVGFDVPGVNEVIKPGINGELAPEGDVDAFAAHVIALLSDPVKAQAYGEAARRIALEQYTADVYPDKWVAIWLRTLTKGKRR